MARKKEPVEQRKVQQLTSNPGIMGYQDLDTVMNALQMHEDRLSYVSEVAQLWYTDNVTRCGMELQRLLAWF